MLVGDEEIAREKAALPPIPASQTPWQQIYRATIGQLATGACLELAVPYRGVGKTCRATTIKNRIRTMTLTGQLLLGSRAVWGQQGSFQALDPATGELLAPAFSCAGQTEVEQACALAAAAFGSFRQTSSAQRADFLEKIAVNIIALGDALIERAASESGLPRARLEGERGRTVNQLRLFGTLLRSGSWQGVRVDRALPERTPLPRPDLRLRHIGIGPVAVFGASNFPLAFSVAGGDTASALAAGCPVVVKAHPAHPGTSELVGRAIQQAVAECGLHEGVFSLLSGPASNSAPAWWPIRASRQSALPARARADLH